MMRILIVDDDPRTGVYLQKGLTETGYVVDWITDGIAARYQAEVEDYDLIVLGVTLPGQEGWTLLHRLRRDNSVPVLFLTTRDDVRDHIEGLELGADDYLVKPFEFVELMVRVKSLLRRGQPREIGVMSGIMSGALSDTLRDTLRVRDLELDLLRRKAVRQGDTILLTAKEFGLLWLLMRRTGEVLPRATIVSQVWDMNFDSDTNVVDSAIRRLRAKVDDRYQPKLIHTVRRMGYVLEERSDG